MNKKERYDKNAREIWDNILSKEIPVPDGYKEFLIDTVFETARYLFMYRKEENKKAKYGYCTHCNTETEIDSCLKHNQVTFCANCHSEVTCKATGLQRKNLYHNEKVTMFLPSERGGLIVRGVEVKMDFSGDFHHVEPIEANPWMIAYFEPNYYGVFKKHYCYNYKHGRWKEEYIAQPNAPRDAIVKEWNEAPVKYDYVFGEENIGKGKLQYMPFEQYRDSLHKCYYNPSKFIQFYCEYPILCEKLVKEGYSSILEERLEYDAMGGLNLKATTVAGCLGLNKNERKLLTYMCSPSVHYLKAIQTVKKNNLPVNRKNCDFVASVLGRYYLKECLKYISLPQLIKITDGNGDLTRDYYDYIQECDKLGYDLSAKAVLLPSDLREAHARTSKIIREKAAAEKAKEYKRKTEKFQKKFLPEYKKKFSFESGQYLIRPAESADELLREGAALNHCVGSYADSYLKGSTIILLIRKKSEPEKPFYTMEINKNGTVIQCRTLHNQSYKENPEVSDFVEQWKKRKKKQRIAV